MIKLTSSTSRFALLASTAALSLWLASCAPMATYPPVETATAASLSRPTFEPVPTVMAEAIRFVQDRHLKSEDIAINLPEGVSHEVYEAVFAKLGGGRPMLADNEPAIHIQEVRTRMFNAQVDIVYPVRNGLNQMATLTLNRTATSKFKVSSERLWHLRNMAASKPHYIAPPEPTPAPSPEASEEPIKAAAVVPEK